MSETVKTCGVCGAVWVNEIQLPEPRGWKVAQQCPVCGGCGLVPCGFYEQYGVATTTVFSRQPCRSCSGTGIVWG